MLRIAYCHRYPPCIDLEVKREQTGCKSRPGAGLLGSRGVPDISREVTRLRSVGG